MKIEVKNLSKRIKGIDIINNINYIFKTNNIYGIYGRNGSGKSVFLKLLCGFYIPTTGSVLLDNIDYGSKNDYLPNCGALIDRPNFIPDLTGFQNLKLLANIQKKINDDAIMESLEVVNLFSEKDKKYSKYSLGMKQKLGIAQAIMENPNIIILDEPFNGVDRESVEKITNYLKEIKKEKIIVVCSHIKDDLNALCDTLINIDNGKIL